MLQSTVPERLGNKDGPLWDGMHGFPWEREIEEIPWVVLGTTGMGT